MLCLVEFASFDKILKIYFDHKIIVLIYCLNKWLWCSFWI